MCDLFRGASIPSSDEEEKFCTRTVSKRGEIMIVEEIAHLPSLIEFVYEIYSLRKQETPNYLSLKHHLKIC